MSVLLMNLLKSNSLYSDSGSIFQQRLVKVFTCKIELLKPKYPFEAVAVSACGALPAEEFCVTRES